MHIPPYICSTCCGYGDVEVAPATWHEPADTDPCPDCEGSGYNDDLRMWVAVLNADTSAYAPQSVRNLAKEYAQ